MTKKQIIEELERIRDKNIDELTELNAKHDLLLQYIAELNVLIQTAMEDDNA